MKHDKFKFLAVLFIGILLGIFGNAIIDTSEIADKHPEVESKTLYTCGMHPEIIEEEPGTCPICGMNLTPIRNGKESNKDNSTVVVDGSVVQNMNVKTDEVREGELRSEILTNGIIKIAEDNEYSVNTKFSGWIEKLYVNYTGQTVMKGDKLLEIYSPELVAAQQEVISALSLDKEDQNNVMLQSAVDKLRLFDISQKEIDRILSSKKVRKYISIYAPVNGTVIERRISEGDEIKQGQNLLKLADLTRLWVIADIYENEVGLVSAGDSVKIKINSLKDEYEGIVSFVYPTLDPMTRTVKVRIDIDNKNGKLKPNMFAEVLFKSESPEKKLVVLGSAVLRNGRKNLIVASLGEGKFKTIEVELGRYSDGFYEVKNGLEKGDIYVTSGQFLIDSESNLQAAVNMYSGKDSENGVKNNSELIRKGVIDVESIDENKDGKVFQDPMDWNVISDKDGRCPICNMFLKEVTIEEAKKNLQEHGYEYK